MHTIIGMAIESDFDASVTLPINKLAVLRADARAAVVLRDSIEDCFSSEWCDAQKEAVEACRRADAELQRLATNPKTRYGSWRTQGDIELMLMGYL